MMPETQYATSGDLHIAYQVSSDGPFDLVLVPGFVSHVEYQWEDPLSARFFERLASFSRLILGIEIRAGLHTGECEMIDDDVGGIAVHIGARVAASAGPSEVLVSSTVKDLVAGSELQFRDHGVHALKGVPGDWRLFAVEAGRPS